MLISSYALKNGYSRLVAFIRTNDKHFAESNSGLMRKLISITHTCKASQYDKLKKTIKSTIGHFSRHFMGDRTPTFDMRCQSSMASANSGSVRSSRSGFRTCEIRNVCLEIGPGSGSGHKLRTVSAKAVRDTDLRVLQTCNQNDVAQHDGELDAKTDSTSRSPKLQNPDPSDRIELKL